MTPPCIKLFHVKQFDAWIDRATPFPPDRPVCLARCREGTSVRFYVLLASVMESTVPFCLTGIPSCLRDFIHGQQTHQRETVCLCTACQFIHDNRVVPTRYSPVWQDGSSVCSAWHLTVPKKEQFFNSYFLVLFCHLSGNVSRETSICSDSQEPLSGMSKIDNIDH